MLLAWLFLQHAEQWNQHAGHSMPASGGPDPYSLLLHHAAGAMVILLGIFTYLEKSELGRRRWVHYSWPVALMLQGTITLLFSENGQLFPFDWDRWLPSHVSVQHKIFAVVAIALGLIELFRRTERLKNRAWPHVLNVLMIGAGVYLLMHQGHSTPVIHTQHLWMGVEIIAIGAVKAATDFQGGSGWVRVYILPALFLALGLQLALYVE
ncbi:MAG: hypothetical protein L0387_34860 [Acidobacteria bacterium]|nr:hypothetical protein [Acidobacteriota bacterium]